MAGLVAAGLHAARRRHGPWRAEVVTGISLLMDTGALANAGTLSDPSESGTLRVLNNSLFNQKKKDGSGHWEDCPEKSNSAVSW